MEEVKILNGENEYVFSLSGEIDSKIADKFYAHVIGEFSKQPKNVVFDCGDLEFIDSTTLGTFVKILKNVKAAGKNMKLVALKDKIKKLFTICSLDSIMEIE